MHLWPDAGVVELFADNGAALPGEAGDLVCTGLVNADMPLIRYRVGDRAALDPDVHSCRCGRTLPRLARIEGRADDALYTRDGRAVGRMDPVFKSRLPVYEAQIIQEALDRVRVRYVPAAGFGPSDGAAIIERIRDRMGDVHVELESVSSIPRTSNGKLRAVVCALSREELERVRAMRGAP
jgi:phenylacetate-CoA ligase